MSMSGSINWCVLVSNGPLSSNGYPRELRRAGVLSTTEDNGIRGAYENHRNRMISVTWYRGLRSLAAICQTRTWPLGSVGSTFLARATEQPGQEDGIEEDSTYLFDAEVFS
jgi:hypothetical protein